MSSNTNLTITTSIIANDESSKWFSYGGETGSVRRIFRGYTMNIIPKWKKDISRLKNNTVFS